MSTMLNNRAKDPTHAVFGIDLEGDTFAMQISEGPHWLLCGQTGSGKSVYANSLLVSMMCHSHPDELKIVWIDPKKVEAGAYVGNPFCPIDPVTDMNDAFGLVQYFCWEMDRRYELLESTGTKQLSEFNEWVDSHPEEAEKRGLTKLPYFVCMIDEYADMRMQVGEVEEGVKRLGQKSRASGIHLIIATQRPSIDNLSPSLKSNIPGRICLKVADATNSGIVIDESGGESLLGYGDSLVKDKVGNLTRVQGPYLSNDEIDNIFAHLREKYGSPEFFDYKQVVVDNKLCDWAEDYGEDVDPKDRHVIKPKRRPGR